MHQQIVHDASQFMQLEAEERHRTRKRAKRLRYGIEFVSSLYSEKEVQHYLKQLRPVQEALGHYNDLIIAEEVFRNAAAQQPTAGMPLAGLRPDRNLLYVRQLKL